MLHTKRLILRAPRAEDLDEMFCAYSDPQAMRYWSTPPHATPETTKDILDNRISHWAEAPVNFQIEMDGAYIGNAGNYARNEIGFMLQRPYWRQGILTEAMEAILPYLWQVTDHDHLFADADPENAASCGLLKSLGFHETHRAKNTFCIAGVWSDSVYFRLNRPD